MAVKLESKASKASLRRLWKAGGGSLSIVPDPGMTLGQLESLAFAHRGEKYSTALFQILANHPNAGGRLFRRLLALGGDASEIASAIILSGRASKSLLRALRKSPSRSVREHADLALIGAELDSGRRENFARLLDRHWGEDGGISLGVRRMLAEHPRTPRPLLRRLATDEADFIANTARKRLDPGSRTGRRKTTQAVRSS